MVIVACNSYSVVSVSETLGNFFFSKLISGFGCGGKIEMGNFYLAILK